MNYSQAAALQLALLQAKLAADALSAHMAMARDIAKRAGLVKMTPEGDTYGIAAGLEFIARKCSFIPQLVEQGINSVEQQLADDGDAIARKAIEDRAKAQSHLEKELADRKIKRQRKERYVKSTEESAKRRS